MAKLYDANPFTPVFGKVPPYLAGREDIIDNLCAALEQPIGNPDSCSIFVGARGTGKTTLLGALANEAEQRGWVSANVFAQEGMLEDIVQRTKDSAAHLIESDQKRSITGVSVAHIGGLTFDTLKNDSASNWRTQMNELFAQIEETNTGLLITVDEVDSGLDELKQLISTYQMFVRENKKVMLLMAGLPHQVSSLLSGRTTSFLRRATRYNLGPIPSYEVRDAFRLTVISGGREITDEAVEEAVRVIDGFPYMFQLVGFRAWNYRRNQKLMEVEDIINGARSAEEQLEAQVYDATFKDLSDADIAFLEAMAQDEKETTRIDLMDRLGKPSSHISAYKKRLLDGGLIEEPRRSVFVFALPKLREYILENYSNEDQRV